MKNAVKLILVIIMPIFLAGCVDIKVIKSFVQTPEECFCPVVVVAEGSEAENSENEIVWYLDGAPVEHEPNEQYYYIPRLYKFFVNCGESKVIKLVIYDRDGNKLGEDEETVSCMAE